jgi:superfamily II RNA helicase
MIEYRDYILDDFQREALEAVRAGENVIVAAPTGCGKTLVAEYAIERALAEGSRIVYTAPIKALSNQKFRDFGALYGARVGIMTGDVTINPSADAIIMTTEIFRNTIFDNPSRLKGIRYVVLDEVHYMDDPERGTVWEESIIFAPPEIRFIALSATISNLGEFAAWIRSVRPGPVRVVLETRRPVPLHPFVFTGEETIDLRRMKGRSFRAGRSGRGGRRAPRMHFSEQNRRLIDIVEERGHLPCIYFLFSRDACEKMAFASAGRDLVSQAERRELERILLALTAEFDLVQDPGMERLAKLLRRGIAFHHAGMLPTWKEVVERLFTSGLIKLLFATETFSVGINMPARAVAFESLKKFDGVKRDYMKAREFLQMAGRAGRRGIDEEGFVYACVEPQTDAPADVRRVMLGEVEEVDSQFNLSYATLLSLYPRLGEAIFEACEKSFAHFRYRKRKGGPFQDMVSQVKRRIRLLEEQGYLEGTRLTRKGRFASLIYGYEIQAAELFERGFLQRLGPVELCVVLAAIVFESKRDTWYVPLRREIQEPLRREVREAIEPFCEAERALGLPQTKRPDWNLSRLVYEWARGAPFESLGEYTDLSPGDVIRTLRLAIQLLRQLGKPLRFMGLAAGEEARFRGALREATACLKRDAVDAERQLRQAVKAEAGEEALAHIPPEEAEENVEGEPRLEHVLARHEPEESAVDIVIDTGLVPEEEEAPPPAAPRRPARGLPREEDFGWIPAGEKPPLAEPRSARKRRPKAFEVGGEARGEGRGGRMRQGRKRRGPRR